MSNDGNKRMKRNRSTSKESASRRSATGRHAMAWTLLLLLPQSALVVAQSNVPVTGSMLQETPEQRARMQQSPLAPQVAPPPGAGARAQPAAIPFQQGARQPARAATAPAAGPVVRQSPNPAVAPAPAAPAVPAAPAAMRVETVTAPAPPAMPAPAPAIAAPAPRSIPDPVGRQYLGDVSRSVLKMQAEGDYGVPPQPILGPAASAMWTRYVESFTKPVPEFFPTSSSPK